MAEDFDLKPLDESHLPDVANVHIAAFPTSILTRFGPEAVRRYYEWQLNGPHDRVALGAWSSGSLVGFIFAGRFDAALFGFLRRERWHLAARMLRRPAMILDRELRPSLRTGLRSLVRRRAGPPPDPVHRARSYGVLAIAVLPVAQGTGAAQGLLDAAESAARSASAASMHLTVAPENTRAVRFYERNGWARLADEGSEWSGRMRKPLST